MKNFIRFYYNQNNYSTVPYNKPDGTKKNIATSGCGVCSTAMAINNSAGKEIFTIETLANISIKCGARDNYGTNVKTLLNKICKLNNNVTFDCSDNVKDLVKHIKKGNVAIIHQGDSYDVFSSGGHFVYAYGLDENKNVIVADPNMKPNRYSKQPRCNRIIKTTKYGCIVKPSEINKAATKIKFYLIKYNGAYFDEIISSPCTLFKTNGIMLNDQDVYCDNEHKIKIGKVFKNERIRILSTGTKNATIKYGISKNCYKVGLVPTNAVKKD